MDIGDIRRLDVKSLLGKKTTRVETTRVETTEFVQSQQNDSSPKDSLVEIKDESNEIKNEAVNELDELGNQLIAFGPRSNEADKETTLKNILEKYNKKYNTNLEYSTLTDALDLAVSADKSKSELTNAIVNNSISAVCDFTTFSMIILVCQQINGVITELLEDNTISIDARVSLVDRLFLWIQRLQSVKSIYSKQDIDHLIRKFENKNVQSGNAKIAVSKLLSLLKLDSK